MLLKIAYYSRAFIPAAVFHMHSVCVLQLYMAGKTTSAGYRLPIVTSGYHEKCIATSVKAIKDVSDKTSDKTYSSGAYRDCNVVAQERIWAEYVQRELKQAKTW